MRRIFPGCWKKQRRFDEIETNSDLAVELLRNSAEDVIELLRRNSVTGAFLVLEGSPAVDDNGGTVKNGLYFRDMDPSSTSQDNSDILIERAPTAITKELGIPMDSEWHPVFLFSGENDQRNLFYQNPIRAAQSYPEAEPKELGYWSKPFYLDERSVPVITYSMPLSAGWNGLRRTGGGNYPGLSKQAAALYGALRRDQRVLRAGGPPAGF